MTYNAAENSKESYNQAIEACREKLESFPMVEIGDCRLYQGDCLEIMPYLPRFDAVVTDPPYGIGERKGTIAKNRKKNEYNLFYDTEENVKENVVPAVKIALQKSERAIITPGPRTAWFYPRPKDLGMMYQPASCGISFWGRCTCQPILFYGKDPRQGKTIQPMHWQVTEQPEKNGHPCPKPINFWQKLTQRASLDGDSILDPFMGSGTTGVACVKLGRKFTGIELDPKYFDIACKRVEEAYSQPDLFIEADKPKPRQTDIFEGEAS